MQHPGRSINANPTYTESAVCSQLHTEHCKQAESWSLCIMRSGDTKHPLYYIKTASELTPLQPNLALITQKPELIWTDLSETSCTSRNSKYLCANCWLLFWQVCCTLCYPGLSATSIILRKWETLDVSPIFIAITMKIQKYLQPKCLRIQKNLKLDTVFEPNKKNLGISRVSYKCGVYTGALRS